MPAEKTTPSNLELQVLSVLWKRGPSTVREVLEILPDGKERAYTTILTILQLMEKKKLVRHTRDKLTHIYQARVTQQDVLAPLMKGLIQKVFGGSPSAAFQYLLKEEDLDPAELSEMQRLIKEHAQKPSQPGRKT